MTDETAPVQGNRAALLLVAGLLIPLMYVLSPAPLEWILRHCHERLTIDSTPGEFLYAPLIWACHHFDRVDQFYESYFTLLGLN